MANLDSSRALTGPDPTGEAPRSQKTSWCYNENINPKDNAMQRLLYGTTTSLVVTICERFRGSLFRLYFADDFNAWPHNPPSSNPFQLFLDYNEIFRTNDIINPKYVIHKRGVRRFIRKKLTLGTPDYANAQRTVQVMGIHAIQPYLAILEVTTYQNNHHSILIQQLPPNTAGSPTSVEYLVDDIHVPTHSNPDMHLQKLHF